MDFPCTTTTTNWYEVPAAPPQQPQAPDPAKLAVVQEQLKRIKAAAYTSDIDLLIAKNNEVLAAVEPRQGIQPIRNEQFSISRPSS
jgi:hypothetical protein